MGYFKDLEAYGTLGDEWDGPIPAVYSLSPVPVRYAKEYCPGCGEIVAAGEPCECVFVARGTIDAQGVLHTARRVPVAGDEPAEFPRGEFDDGQQLCEPAKLPEPNRWDWLTERGGEPEVWEPVHD